MLGPRSGSECTWPDDLDVYMLQFPPQGGTWYQRLMLEVTSCGRKCAANKPEPGSAHDRRHIMTSPGHTGISRRDIQTSAPNGLQGLYGATNCADNIPSNCKSGLIKKFNKKICLQVSIRGMLCDVPIKFT